MMDCCQKLCKEGDHCWIEGPVIRLLGSRDAFQMRHCKHCQLRQTKEWRDN